MLHFVDRFGIVHGRASADGELAVVQDAKQLIVVVKMAADIAQLRIDAFDQPGKRRFQLVFHGGRFVPPRFSGDIGPRFQKRGDNVLFRGPFVGGRLLLPAADDMLDCLRTLRHIDSLDILVDFCRAFQVVKIGILV